ncbi:MAG: M12 family metallo-peptidase [Candidatus Kapaibacterium sp.]
MKTLFAFCILVSTAVSALAQYNQSNVTNNISNQNTVIFKSIDESTIQVNKDVFTELLYSQKQRLTISNFSLPNRGDVTLILNKFNPITSNARFVVGDTNGNRTIDREPGLFFKGTIAGFDSSFVYLALYRDYCYGIIETNYISPGQHSQFQLIPKYYDGKGTALISVQEKNEQDNIFNGTTNKCFTIDTSNSILPNKKNRLQSNRTMLETDIAVETDYLFANQFKDNGVINYAYATNFALAIMAGASAIYERDIQIKIRVNFLRVWLVDYHTPTIYPYPECTDYNNTYIKAMSYNNPCALETHWNDNNKWNNSIPERSMVHCISGGSTSGIANWFGVVCTDKGFDISGSVTWSLFASIGVTAHELGHSFGSMHSDDYDPLVPCDESGYGEIMKGSVNYPPCPNGQKMHFHPRVQTVIRDELESKICQPTPCNTCVHPIQQFANDVKLLTIQEPVAGITVNNGKLSNGCPQEGGPNFTPRVTIKNIGGTVINTPTNVKVQFKNKDGAYIPYGSGGNNFVILTVNTLQIDEVITLQFPSPTCANLPADGSPYTIVATVQNTNDPVTTNNRIDQQFLVIDGQPNNNYNLTITYPNAQGIIFTAGQEVNITFTPTTDWIFAHIQFSSDNGATWYPITDGYIRQSPYLWKVPSIQTTQGKLRIYRDYESFPAKEIDFPFAINVLNDVAITKITNPPYAEPEDNPSVIAPFKPQIEVMNLGTLPQSNVIAKVKIIRAIIENGVSKEKELFSQTKSIGTLTSGQITTVTFDQVNFGLLPSGNVAYMIFAEVQSSLDDNLSNNSEARTFRVPQNDAPLIVSAPMGNTIIQVGSSYIINWKGRIPSNPMCNQPPVCKIEYSLDGLTWTTITNNASTIAGLLFNEYQGTYTWEVDNTPSKYNTVRIRITANDNMNNMTPPCKFIGESEYFTITKVEYPSNFTLQNRSVGNNPRVKLLWSKPSSTITSGYNIYRAVNDGAFTLYQQITSNNILTFDDDVVSNCVKYSYYMTSFYTVNGTTFESDPSPIQTIMPIPTWETDKTFSGNARAWNPGNNTFRFDPYGDAGGQPIRSSRVQFIIRASDLTANGFTNGAIFTDIGFWNAWAKHGKTLKNFRIRMKYTTDDRYSNTNFDNTGLTTVFGSDDPNNPTYFTPFQTQGIKQTWDMHSLKPLTPWDGTANLLVDVSFVQDNNTSQTGIIASNDYNACLKFQIGYKATLFTSSPNNDVSNTLSGSQASQRLNGSDGWIPDFKLIAQRPQLVMLQPNTSVTWFIGRTYDIAWDPGCSEDLQKVNLQCIDVNNTANNQYITTTTQNNTTWVSGTQNTGSFSWTIPSTFPEIPNAKMRVEGYGNPAFFDDSNVPFTIRNQSATITVLQPTATTNWMVGERRTIQWTTTGSDAGLVQYVKIEYSTNGVDWQTIVAAINNNGSYEWDISNNIQASNGGARIRISDVLNPLVNGVSSLFTINLLAAPTNVTAVASTVPSNRITVTWTQPTGIDPTQHNGYFICRGNSPTSTLPITAVTAGSNQTQSYIDNTALPCVRYYYTVQTRLKGGGTSAHSNSANDMITPSNLTFAVVTPNGGERWYVGTVHEIIWNICATTFQTVNIYYSLDNGQNWISIASSIPNNGSYPWLVPNQICQNVKIKVASAGTSESDESNSVFEIAVLPPASVATGDYHNVILKPSNGAIFSWGYNSTGQLGVGSTNSMTVPTQIQNFTNAIQVAVGASHSLVLKNNGTVWACGSNYIGTDNNTSYFGKLGIDNSTNDQLTLIQIPYAMNGNTQESFNNIISVAAGGNSSVALKSNGDVYCWGKNNFGQCGDGNISASGVTKPKKVEGIANVIAVAAGETYTMALKNDGTLWAWGSLEGQTNLLGVGDGVEVVRMHPTFVMSGVISISTHTNFAMALKSDGTVYIWGNNIHQQLGLGNNTGDKSSPQKILNLNSIEKVFCASNTGFALSSTGSLYSWGFGTHGERGDGSNSVVYSPVQVTTNVANVVTVSGGQSSATMYKADGTICTTGWNYLHMLGDPNHTQFYERNTFDCLTGDYSKFVNNKGGENSDYEYIHENEPQEGDDTTLLKFRVMKLVQKNNVTTTNSSVICSPNPTNGIIYFTLPFEGTTDVNVYNSLGCNFGFERIENPTINKRYRMDLSTLSSGIYYITLSSVEKGNQITIPVTLIK